MTSPQSPEHRSTKAWNWTRWYQTASNLIEGDHDILCQFYRHLRADGDRGG
jgi:hypothetical protein